MGEIRTETLETEAVVLPEERRGDRVPLCELAGGTRTAMIERILVGYDGSDLAEKALDRACDLAEHYGASLTILTAVVDRLFREDGVLTPALDEEKGRELAAKGARKARGRGIAEVEELTSLDSPNDALVDVAGDGFDLVEVGHRSRSPLAELVLGSTAKRVVDHAPCSVLVVR